MADGRTGAMSVVAWARAVTCHDPRPQREDE